MRVLHVIDSLGIGGGAERNLAAVLPRLGALQHHVVHLDARDGYAAGLRAAGVTVERIALDGLGSAPRAFASLARLAARADVVHTQTVWSDLIGRLAALGRPVVTSVQFPAYEPHIVAGYSRKGRLLARAIQVADGALSRRARAVVAVSEYVRQTVVDNLAVPVAKTRVVYNAVPVDEVRRLDGAARAEVRRGLGIDDDARAIVSVGKLSWIKGQELLVEALPELARRDGRVVLLLPGTGPRQDALAARAVELGVADRVRLLGLRTDLPRILGASDVFALASRSEGLSLAVAEAMSASLPCILSDIPPHREMERRVAEDGRAASDMIVAERTPAAYAEALARVLLDEDLRLSLGARSRAAAERHFNVEVTAPALASVFAEAASHASH